MRELTLFEKKLLNIIQGNIPISHKPFEEIGKMLDCTENDVIITMQKLKQEGYIRKMGVFFNSEKLGYKGSLIALKVKNELIEETAKVINEYSTITHNYEREGEYNLWFTILAPSDELRQAILLEIKSLPGVEDMLELDAIKKYKINVRFNLKE